MNENSKGFLRLTAFFVGIILPLPLVLWLTPFAFFWFGGTFFDGDRDYLARMDALFVFLWLVSGWVALLALGLAIKKLGAEKRKMTWFEFSGILIGMPAALAVMIPTFKEMSIRDPIGLVPFTMFGPILVGLICIVALRTPSISKKPNKTRIDQIAGTGGATD